MSQSLNKQITKSWQIPNYKSVVFEKRKTKYCLCIPVINEGEKIKKQIVRLERFSQTIDIIIADGGSTDGSMEQKFLKVHGVRALLIKHNKGKLSAQLRMAFAYALQEGYEGIITMDGNGKDDPKALPLFIKALDEGYGFIQGSRFIKGGIAKNTPLSRLLAIRLIHAPIISIASGFYYTDTTNGFRGHSRRLLLDSKLQPFRNIFNTYELLVYLSIKSKRLGYKVTEIPVIRVYPHGKIPTKINGILGNLHVLKILILAFLGKYNANENG